MSDSESNLAQIPAKKSQTGQTQIEMKCRKCRIRLLTYPETRVESSHGNLAHDYDTAAVNCTSDVWYIPEEHMPSWMTVNLEKGDWVKGKVACPKCEARLGSYNFVSGMKCPCGSQVVAPIHIVRSKVDFVMPSMGESTRDSQTSLEDKNTAESPLQIYPLPMSTTVTLANDAEN